MSNKTKGLEQEIKYMQKQYDKACQIPTRYDRAHGSIWKLRQFDMVLLSYKRKIEDMKRKLAELKES